MTLHFPDQPVLGIADILAATDYPADHRGHALRFCQQWLRGDPEFIVHTSGSTGAPKPITLSRAQMEASARLTAQALGLYAGDRALVCLNPAYIAGIMMLVRGLVNDLALTITSPSAQPFAHTDGAIFDFMAVVPLQLETLLSEPDRNGNLFIINQMKAIIVGGAPVGQALEAQLQGVEAPIYATYGMTETVSHIALRRLNGPARSQLYTALPGVILGQDARGCLTVAAPMTLGQTLVTNDLVRLETDQSFEWLGRADNVINSGGVKVQIEQVEQAVDNVFVELQLAQRFVVMGQADPRLGEKVVLITEGSELPPGQQLEIRTRLATRLGRYHRPQAMLHIQVFPETATGKVDRQQLKAYLDEVPTSKKT
jgi:o-succinylbenzoate---CoA ligase